MTWRKKKRKLLPHHAAVDTTTNTADDERNVTSLICSHPHLLRLRSLEAVTSFLAQPPILYWHFQINDYFHSYGAGLGPSSGQVLQNII